MVEKLNRGEIVSKINALSVERMRLLSNGHENLTDDGRKKEQELQDQIDSLVDILVELENE